MKLLLVGIAWTEKFITSQIENLDGLSALQTVT